MAGPVLIPGALQPIFIPQTFGPFPNNAGTALYVPGFSSWNSNGVDPGQAGVAASIGMFSSSDLGATWAEQDAGASPTAGGLDSLSPMVTVPNAAEGRFFVAAKHPTLDEIWVVFLAGGGDSWHAELAVAVFDMGTNTWGPASLSGIVVDMSPSYNGGADYHQGQSLFAMAADFDSNSGELFVVYQWLTNNYTPDTSPDPQLVYYPQSAKFDGSSWIGFGAIPGVQTYPVAYPGSYADLYTVVSVGRGAGGRVHAVLLETIAGSPTMFYMWHYLLSDGAGGQGATIEQITLDELTVAYNFSPSTPQYNTYQALTYNPANSQIAIMVQNITTANWGVAYATSVDSPSWSYTDIPAGDWASAPTTWNVVDNGVLNLMGPNSTSTGWRFIPWTGSAYGSESSFWTGVSPADCAIVSANRIGSVGMLYTPPADIGLATGAPITFYGLLLTPGLDIIGTSIVGGSSVPSGGSVGLTSAPGLPPQPTQGGVFPSMPWPPDYQIPNMYDCCLDKFAQAVRNKPILDGSRCVVWHYHPDGTRMPVDGVEFWESSSIVTPSSPSALNTVLRFQVPTGYKGMIYGLVLQYTGTGFVDGSGDIVWRVQIGQAWGRDLGNVKAALGVPGQCFPLNDYIQLIDRQVITVYVQIPNLSGNIQVGASRILATVQGWYYPQR